jgi:hypothetical protein
MKITIWTLAADTDEGLFSSAHLTKEDAEGAREALQRIDWERRGKGGFPGSEEAMEKLSSTVGYMDSYTISSDELDVPDVVAPLPDWVDDFIKRRTEVEHVLRLPYWAQQKGTPAPDPLTPERLWELANKLSIPTEVTTSLAKAANNGV